jgi:protein-tyrosine phosphatase
LLGLYIFLGLIVLLVLITAILLWQSRIKTLPYDRQFAILHRESIVVERRNERAVILSWKSGTRPNQIFLGKTPADFDTQNNLLPKEHANHLIVEDLDPSGRPYFLVELQDGRRLVIAERVLQMENVRNFRDIGGYFTRDGRQVAWGRIYRSGHLGNPSEKDLVHLGKLGITLAVDLRDESEIANRPDHLTETMRHAHIFIANRELIGRSTALFGRQNLARQFQESYKSMLIDQGAKAYGKVLQTLSDPQNLPAVLHCTAGKDRTGVAIALLLHLLGVPESTIIADYTLSNLFAPVQIQELRALLRRIRWLGFKVEQYYPLIAASAQNMQRSLQYIHEKYGSVDNYLLTAAGLTEEDLHKLRQMLLMENPSQ